MNIAATITLSFCGDTLTGYLMYDGTCSLYIKGENILFESPTRAIEYWKETH